MKYKHIGFLSLKRNKQVIFLLLFFIIIAAAAISTVCLLMSSVSCVYKITGLILQLVLVFYLIYAAITTAVIGEHISRPGFVLISGSGMKAMIFLIILFSIINTSFALYLIASGFAYPEGFSGLSLGVVAPLLISSFEGYVYSDQEYLFLGTRKLTVPIKEIAKVDITRRKLGMGYLIGLTDCRGLRTRFVANELLKDKFIEFIGKYDAGITIYD